MASNYSIGDVRIDESQALLRVASLSAGSVSYDGLSLSFGPGFGGSSEAGGLATINEGYMYLTLPQLRELDSNPARQDAYTRKKLRSPDAGRLNIIFVNLLLEKGDKIVPKDVEYLNDLLLWSQNHIYVPPAVTYAEGTDLVSRIAGYTKFLNDILEVKRKTVSSPLRVGAIIPSYFGRGLVDDLLSVYQKEEKEPTFVAVDYGNSRISTLSNGQKIAYLHRHFKAELHTEKYFLYALRAKSRKRGLVPAPAEDLASLLAGINALGPTHNRGPGGGEIPFSWNMLTGLDRVQHRYDRIVSHPALRKAFIDFVKTQTAIPPPVFGSLAMKEDAKFMAVVRNFNRRAVNQEGGEIAKAVSGGDTSTLKGKLSGKESLGIAKRALAS